MTVYEQPAERPTPTADRQVRLHAFISIFVAIFTAAASISHLL
ncbi:MAG TPA: hypothetical protein VGM39_24800 [Kofleriaceae bacterium]